VLSPSLRAEVATQTSVQWIRNLRYFRNCEEDFLIDLSMQLQPQTYTPKECIIKIGDAPNKLYIVRRGVVACEGMIYCRGGVFATDMLQVCGVRRALGSLLACG
jgi:signal-transduction protein with cAMP-binding, CBS, and nucleotidyltransferase domain